MNTIFPHRQKVSGRHTIISVKRRKSGYVGFRAERELEDLINRAIEATGTDATELLKRCVRRAMGDVVLEIMRERQRAHSEFQNYLIKPVGPDSISKAKQEK